MTNPEQAELFRTVAYTDIAQGMTDRSTRTKDPKRKKTIGAS